MIIKSARLFPPSTTSAIQIFVAVIIVYGTRVLSVYLTEEKTQRDGKIDDGTEQDFLNFLEKQEETNRIVEDFGRFLELEKPLISDIDYLPYPKTKIHTALLKKEQEMCEIANNYVKKGENEKLPEIEKLIGALSSCRVFLKCYTEIEDEDRETVDYFNSYQDKKEVPEEEQNEFAMLRAKYMTKWLREENYGENEET